MELKTYSIRNILGVTLACALVIKTLIEVSGVVFPWNTPTEHCRSNDTRCMTKEYADIDNLTTYIEGVYERKHLKEPYHLNYYIARLSDGDVETIKTTWTHLGGERFMSPNGEFMLTGRETVYRITPFAEVEHSCENQLFCELPVRFMRDMDGVVVERPYERYDGVIKSFYDF